MNIMSGLLYNLKDEGSFCKTLVSGDTYGVQGYQHLRQSLRLLLDRVLCENKYVFQKKEVYLHSIPLLKALYEWRWGDDIYIKKA